jgi:hypothetical protein
VSAVAAVVAWSPFPHLQIVPCGSTSNFLEFQEEEEEEILAVFHCREVVADGHKEAKGVAEGHKKAKGVAKGHNEAKNFKNKKPGLESLSDGNKEAKGGQHRCRG